MNTQVEALLKDQINKEFYSAYLYLAMSNYYYGENLDGFGHWFEVQAREEQEHAMKILKYLQDNGVKVELAAIAAPGADFSDYRAPLTAALKHEQYVTSLIHAIYKQARDSDDFRACQFLEWFVAEQGEEEKSTADLIAKFDLLGGDAKGLYLLNAELKNRA
ncbi:MAG: ferritin [Desulfovibrionaceae bacterium]|nr:MAG: ferritin [Desulfovibrionaceae bacterium]